MQCEFTGSHQDLVRDSGGVKYVDLKRKIIFSSDTKKAFYYKINTIMIFKKVLGEGRS